MAFFPYSFTDQQKVDIRRFAGYPALGDGNLVYPYPWIMKQYLALEYKLDGHVSASEGAVVVQTYLANLYALESAIPMASQNLDTDQAGPWKHNKSELRDRAQLFDMWRRRLCSFLGIPTGPELGESGGGLSLVV